MSEISDRYRRIAAAFTERVHAVPAGAWDNPAPCEGWVARDVVGHMVEWMPHLLKDAAGIELPAGPSAAEDPVGAWDTMNAGLQAVLDDPDVDRHNFVNEHIGTMPVSQAVNMIMVNDVFLHTWDLARATGLDETLDPDEAAAMFAGMEPMDEMLRNSGQYGPRVAVPDDADAQTKLMAFIGRQV